MGLFDKLFKKEEEVVLPALENVADEDIVAIADGELIDVSTVSDPVFAEQMMGKSTAFKFDKDKVVLCSPANGTLAVLFPTGHAYGIAMNNGVEKQGDAIKAGDPIVEVDIKKLSKTYDMSTMLIITNANDKELDFVDPQTVTRGQKVIK